MVPESVSSQNGASTDFSTGVRALLVEKSKERPQWSPATVKEVSDEIVSRFFAPTSPYLSSALKLSIPKDVTSGTSKPMKYALPTEEEIGTMVRGSHNTGGASGITLKELIAKFENLRKGKAGVKDKIVEVVQRKCDTVDNGGDGNFVWLKWRHSLNRP